MAGRPNTLLIPLPDKKRSKTKHKPERLQITQTKAIHIKPLPHARAHRPSTSPPSIISEKVFFHALSSSQKYPLNLNFQMIGFCRLFKIVTLFGLAWFSGAVFV